MTFVTLINLSLVTVSLIQFIYFLITIKCLVYDTVEIPVLKFFFAKVNRLLLFEKYLHLKIGSSISIVFILSLSFTQTK